MFGKANVDWQQRIDFDRLRKDRIARANQMLHKHGIGAAIVYNWDSRRYLGNAWNHPYSRHAPVDYVLFIRDAGFPYVRVTKGLDDAQVAKDAPWLEGRFLYDSYPGQYLVTRMTPQPAAGKLWGAMAGEVKGLMREHGVEGLPVSVDYAGPNLIHALEKEGLTVADGNGWMQEARMVKTDTEIELMKMSASINEAGYGALVQELRPGMTESDARAIMVRAIYAAGAEYLEGWVTNAGTRAAPRNFNWSDAVIRPGDLLTMEACHVTFCGYKTCYDRTFCVGRKPTELQKELYGVAVDMQYQVQELLRPGITTHDAARLRPSPAPVFKRLEDIKQYRAKWKNHFGGIGISWWEAPYLFLEEPAVTLEKNMTIAYHALYWIDGEVGVAIENTYRLTDNGCELLQKWPWEELTVIAG